MIDDVSNILVTIEIPIKNTSVTSSGPFFRMPRTSKIDPLNVFSSPSFIIVKNGNVKICENSMFSIIGHKYVQCHIENAALLILVGYV